jgi:hypothetical protein
MKTGTGRLFEDSRPAVPHGAEARCICGWSKVYRNPVAAQFGLEFHWVYGCPFAEELRERLKNEWPMR